MKKVFYLCLSMMFAIPTITMAMESSNMSPTSIATGTNDWESLGTITLYCNNGHGYVQRVESAHLYISNAQGTLLYKVVRLLANGQESSEVLFVSKLATPWYPQGSVNGQSNPTSFNATAGDFYLNI